MAGIRLEATDTEEKQVTEEKRLYAERLALEAERAELEAEQLMLQVEQMRLATAQRRAITDASGATVPDAPLPEVAPPPLDRDPWMQQPDERPAADKSRASDGSQDLPAVLFNLSGDGNISAVPPPPMQQALSAVLPQGVDLCVSPSQVSALKAEVFGIETFYVTSVESSAVGTVFRGNVKGEPQAALAKAQERLAATAALEGVTLLLMIDPLPLSLAQLQNGEDKAPVFVALSPAAAAMRQPPLELGTALVGLGLGSFTTLGYALSAFILADNGRVLQQLQDGDAAPLALAAPIALGVGSLTLLHELAHVAAAWRLKIKSGVPVVVPSLQLGLYGCVTRLLSFPASRTDLFDFAASGPLVGGGASLLAYVFGLMLSIDPPPPSADTLLPVLPTGLLQSSWLLGNIAQLVLPQLAESQTVTLHPFAVVGFTGAILNALQLLPVGRLDGGRICTAVLGGEGAAVVSGLGLLLLGFQSIFGGDNPVLLYFGVLTIFFQRAPDLPAANDLDGVDTKRKAVAAAAALFVVLMLIPCAEITSTAGLLDSIAPLLENVDTV